MSDAKQNSSSGIKRFKPYFALIKPVKKQFALGLLMGVLYGVASGAGLPYLTKVLLPILTEKPLPDTLTLVAYISVFPLGMLFRAVCGYFNTYLTSYCGVQVLLQLRSNVMKKLQSLPLSFYHENTVGDLMARVTGDTGSLQQVLTQVANDLIKQPVTLIAAVGYLIYLAIAEKEASFLLMFLATVPAIILPLQIFGKRVLKRAKQVQSKSGDISNYVSENLNAVREVRAFNLQGKEMDRFDSALERFAALSMKVVKYSKIIRPSIEVVGMVCVTGAVVYMLERDIIAIAASMLVALYMAYDPVKRFGEIHVMFKRGEAALERVEYILNAENKVPEPEDPQAMGRAQGRVDFEGVHFRYLEEWVLKDVNLTFTPGSVVALVGPSGAGKTTIADLIPRFYDVQKGSVKIDGVDVRDVSKHDLRENISVVSQDTFLFNDSILENIRLGKPGASDVEVQEAAQHAFAHDFILELEEGYNTVVGERGTRLSGGAKTAHCHRPRIFEKGAHPHS